MFTNEDLSYYRAFKDFVGQGKFEIQGKAAIAASSIFKWYYDLESKIIEDIKTTEMKKKAEEKGPKPCR
jgi:hypothetical protein